MVSIAEARRSRRKRLERDVQLVADLPDDLASAFLEHAAMYDRRQRVREELALQREEADVADTRAGMLARVDSLIVDLVEQLGWTLG